MLVLEAELLKKNLKRDGASGGRIEKVFVPEKRDTGACLWVKGKMKDEKKELALLRRGDNLWMKVRAEAGCDEYFCCHEISYKTWCPLIR